MLKIGGLARPVAASCSRRSLPGLLAASRRKCAILSMTRTPRANRNDAMRCGFLSRDGDARSASMSLDHVRSAVTARDAVHLVLTLGLAAALVRLRHARTARAPRWLNGLPTGLKERRDELGLTQAELAEQVGVTRKTVNTVENGVFTPSATAGDQARAGAWHHGRAAVLDRALIAPTARIRSPWASAMSARCMPQPGRNMPSTPTSPPMRSVRLSPGRRWCGSTDSRAGRR